MSTEVVPAGNVNLSVVEFVPSVGVDCTVLLAAMTLRLPLIKAFGSVTSTSPGLSNVSVTDLPSLIFTSVSVDVVDVLVTSKLLPSAVFAVILDGIGWPPVLPPPPPAAATLIVPTMFGCNAQKYG